MKERSLIYSGNFCHKKTPLPKVSQQASQSLQEKDRFLVATVIFDSFQCGR
jgi:hypothetical protein